VANISESTIIDEIESAAQKTSFVIVDLEGTASMMVAYAISRADLVIIPTQGSQLDAAEAAKAIKLILQQEKAFTKKIPYAILFTRTSAPSSRARCSTSRRNSRSTASCRSTPSFTSAKRTVRCFPSVHRWKP